jgi:hypothetical protein
MDGVTDVPAPRSVTSIASREPQPADPWSTWSPLIIALAIVVVNLLAYGVALMVNPQSDPFDWMRIGITTIVVVAVAVVALVASIAVKVSDDAVPVPVIPRR